MYVEESKGSKDGLFLNEPYVEDFPEFKVQNISIFDDILWDLGKKSVEEFEDFFALISPWADELETNANALVPFDRELALIPEGLDPHEDGGVPKVLGVSNMD